ncbi:MAG: TldD/PmbA family protein, partial [Gemmatimonadaceae bacterium]|nr:TldD/PmbA family protein [Gemmatimonadaceae bacterium]
MPRSLRDDDVVLSRDEAQRVVEQVVRLSKTDGVQVALRSERVRNLRFAANQLSTAGVTEDTSAVITALAGRRRASVTTNDLSAEGLERAVRKAESIAALAPEDPEAMPLLAAQTYVAVREAWDEATATLDADTAMAAARSALAPARSGATLEVAGFLLVQGSATAIGNSAGLFAYHRGSRANYTLTARTTDGTGSGWASDDAVAWRALDVQATSQRAIDVALRSRRPVAIEPGRYTVVLQ